MTASSDFGHTQAGLSDPLTSMHASPHAGYLAAGMDVTYCWYYNYCSFRTN